MGKKKEGGKNMKRKMGGKEKKMKEKKDRKKNGEKKDIRQKTSVLKKRNLRKTEDGQKDACSL